MCMTNNQVEHLIKTIRAVEKKKDFFKEQDSKDIGEILALCKELKDSIEVTEKQARKEWIARQEGEIFFYPTLSRKVYLREGNKVREYDPIDTWEILKAKGILDKYKYISKIQVGKVKDENLESYLEDALDESTGSQTVSVLKMTKTELVEHAGE